MSEIILVGLGVSGLACAMELRQQGHHFIAFEKEPVPGGLTRSERREGFTFDYGPHIILETPRLFDQLILDLEDCVCESSIFLDMAKVSSVPSPIQRNLHRLPLAQRLRVFLDIVQRNITRSSTEPENFQQRILTQSGQTLFDLFFQGYETKRLRYRLADIDGNMPNRIQSPALAQLFGFNAIGKPAACGGLDTRFKYPRLGGIDALPSAMFDTLPSGQIHFQHALSEIDVQKKQLTFTNGRQAFFQQVVMSLALPDIISLLKDPPKAVLEAAEHLIFSSLYVLNLGLDDVLPHPWAIARIPRRDVDFYRVTTATHYSKASAPEGSSALTVEVAHHGQRYPLTEMEVCGRIYAGLKQLGILGSQQQVKVEWLHNIRYGHIIYSHKTRPALALIFDYLNGHGIYPCGKYGQWRDMLMTPAMQSGIDVAQRLLATPV
jgi:UDP-galactopyranose mutase